MKANASDLLLTAISPVIWGSTYIVTTQFLPGFSPMTMAVLRALPAGLLLLVIVRQLPTGIWWFRAFVLGALNFSIFLSMLFIAAYRLPGGVAATVLAIQPLIAVFLASLLLARPMRPLPVLVTFSGIVGVALLVLSSERRARCSRRVAAGVCGAASMALGNVLVRKWQPTVPLLTFTAWQLTAGGLLLAPAALLFEPFITLPTETNLLALVWLVLIGTALTYLLWFRGIARLESELVWPLVFLSPMTAVLLGWVFLDQALTWPQIAGVVFVIGSIWINERLNRTARR